MRVGEVVIQGVRDVDTGTVRKIMSVRPGQIFKQDALYQTQRDLYGIGAFSAVNVVLVDSQPPPESTLRDSSVRILLRLQEGPRHQFRSGLGYGSLECFRVQTGWAAHDFLGGARTLDLSARVSKLGGGTPTGTSGLNQLCNPLDSAWTLDTVNYTFGVTLRQPAFLSRRHTASVGLFDERRSEFIEYTREAIGGNADVTFNARGRLPVTLGYGYSYGRTVAKPAIYCNLFRVCDERDQGFLRNRRRFGALSLTFVRDRVNNVLDPSQGSLSTLTMLHSSHLVGSDSTYEFNRGELEISKYYPIGRRTVFAWRIRGGTVLPRDITNTDGQKVGYVPPDQRFYGGGPNSVRGYGRNELGPRVYIISDRDSIDAEATAAAGDTVWSNVTTAPTGGNTAIILNAELRVPSPIFASRMRFAVFVDAGQVWERGQELVTLRDMRVTPGVGVRFTTPLGPVRIDAAYNGYPPERGPLYLQGGTLTRVRASYPPLRAKARRFIVQFAVGQAF
jgi:outer membrane protein insertion porin family